MIERSRVGGKDKGKGGQPATERGLMDANEER